MKRIALTIILIILISTTGPPCSASGGIGYISIPSINCRFDLSWYYSDASAHQHIAMLYKTYGCQTVGNHYGSMCESGGLWKPETVRVGSLAHLEYVRADGPELITVSNDYICYAVFVADVSGNRFLHNGHDIRPFSETDLICVSCVGSDSSRNYVLFFELLN